LAISDTFRRICKIEGALRKEAKTPYTQHNEEKLNVHMSEIQEISSSLRFLDEDLNVVESTSIALIGFSGTATTSVTQSGAFSGLRPQSQPRLHQSPA
jgi:uncharacterized ferredoxin-like protein